MEYTDIELLRFTTAGSVDDGKVPLLVAFYTTVNLSFKTNWTRLRNPVKQKALIMSICPFWQMV